MTVGLAGAAGAPMPVLKGVFSKTGITKDTTDFLTTQTTLLRYVGKQSFC